VVSLRSYLLEQNFKLKIPQLPLPALPRLFLSLPFQPLSELPLTALQLPCLPTLCLPPPALQLSILPPLSLPLLKLNVLNTMFSMWLSLWI